MKKSKRPFKRWEKVIREDRDWDFVYLWILEHAKISHMLKYWEEYTKSINVAYKSSEEKCCSVLRELRLCKNLLEIIIEESGGAWEAKGPGFYTEKVPGKELWELKSNDPDSPGECKRLRWFNKRNCYRFVSPESWKATCELMEKENKKYGYPNYMTCQLENDLRLQKARALYYKIRFYKEETWWE